MFKTFLLAASLITASFSMLQAEIFKINDIDVINESIEADTLVLFNIAEVLMDTETSLGTQAWRKYIRSRTDSKLHDELTLIVFEKAPPKAAQEEIPALIQNLQSQGIVTFAFTSRGRNEWYSSDISNIDLITEAQLKTIDIDFSLTKLPLTLESLPKDYAAFFHEGIIYTGNTLDKGELLVEMLNHSGYKPSKIVFVDDKASSLTSVEKGLKEFPIQFVGYAYGRTALVHADFDPMIANIQLESLLFSDTVLSDAEALEIKKANYQNCDPDQFFSGIINRWKALKIND